MGRNLYASLHKMENVDKKKENWNMLIKDPVQAGTRQGVEDRVPH